MMKNSRLSPIALSLLLAHARIHSDFLRMIFSEKLRLL